jgi:hypothetical protein
MSIGLADPLPRLRVWFRRYSLDRRLADGADAGESPELSCRAAQLLSERTRRRLAVWLESTLQDAQRPPRRSSAALPLDRDAIRTARPELLSLARDLAEVREPVEVRGVARAQLLLSDGASPLYAWSHEHGEASMDATLEWRARHARASLALT